MSGYLKTWRRKLGALTLTLASALLVGWMRSRSVVDVIRYANGHSICAVASMNNGIGLSYSLIESQGAGFSFNAGASLKGVAPLYPFDGNQFQSMGIHATKYECCGFLALETHAATQNTSGNHSHIWFVHYFVPTGALTLLSAWLLLSRPKRISN